MREYSKVSPSIWRSQKMRALGDDSDAKMAYFYILSSPHSNSAGCYDLPEGYGGADLGWETERYRKAIERLKSVGLIEFAEAEKTVLITNWATFNPPTNAKHALGILGQLRQASSTDMKVKAAEAFSQAIAEKGFNQDRALAKAIAGFFDSYRKPIPTETETDTETERETRPDRDKTETRANERAAPDGAAAPEGATPPARREEDRSPLRLAHDFSETAIPDRLMTPTMRGHGPPAIPKRAGGGGKR
jgi:hypothetical protein